MAPIIPWIGGKRRLVDLLLSRFPPHSCYVEVFAGGAAVFFARHPADVEVLNDVNGDLVNLYRVVTHHLEEFVRQFKWAITSRQVFKWLQETRPETLTDVQRAARFFYLQQQSFGGKVAGQTFGKAVVSINDHPQIRECFAGFDMEALKLDYTVGGGANRVERGELVIYSWDRSSEPAGLF